MADKKTTISNQIWIDDDTLKSVGGTLSIDVNGTLTTGAGGYSNNTIPATAISSWPQVKTDTVRIEYTIFNLSSMMVEVPWQTIGSFSNSPSVYLPEVYRLRQEKLRNYGPVDQIHIRIRVISEQTERIMDMIQ